MSRAFQIGKMEALAVAQLHAHVHSTIVADLKVQVAKRGMRGFLTNELVSKGYFSDGFSSGVGVGEPWAAQCINDGAQQLATRLAISRLLSVIVILAQCLLT